MLILLVINYNKSKLDLKKNQLNLPRIVPVLLYSTKNVNMLFSVIVYILNDNYVILIKENH